MTNATLDATRSTPQKLPLRIDESRMRNTYANAIRTSPTNDEVVLDFGMSLPQPAGAGQTAQMFTIDSRVVLNWANAKRVAISLAQMVQTFEQKNGEIDLAPPENAPTAE